MIEGHTTPNRSIDYRRCFRSLFQTVHGVYHHFPEEEIKARVGTIQERNHELLMRAEDATVDLIQALAAAQKSGAGGDSLKSVLELQRKAQWRVDFVNAENSMGFHAPQESARILGEAIDFARQGRIEMEKRR